MSIHHSISARPDPAQTPVTLATAARAPHSGGISARGRLAIIVGLSAWLWAGIVALGYYAIG